MKSAYVINEEYWFGQSVIMKTFSTLYWLLILGFMFPGLAFGDDSKGSISFQVENDMFGGLTDRHYSNGLKVTGVIEKNILTSKLVELAPSLFPIIPAIKHKNIDAVVASLGHNIYTPDDTISRDLVVDDRPYAGWLYGTIGVLDENEENNSLKTLSLDIGVTGPLSFGKQLQKKWHTVFDLKKLNGWDHQLKNELGFILNYDYKKRFVLSNPSSPLEIDLAPNTGFALGNIFTYANGGAMVRVGNKLNIDYGPPRIRPSLPGSGLVKETVECGWNLLDCSWYFFAGIDGRAVARNIFLDGNTFADSHDVKRHPFVGDIQVGFAFTMENIRLTSTYVVRSKEFIGQKNTNRFGALTVTYIF